MHVKYYGGAVILRRVGHAEIHERAEEAIQKLQVVGIGRRLQKMLEPVEPELLPDVIGGLNDAVRIEQQPPTPA